MRFQYVYLLNKDPLILTGNFGTWAEVAKLASPLTFLYHNPWRITMASIPRFWKIGKAFKKGKNIHFITNEESESRWLRLIGLKATALGQTLHVNENLFKPGTEAKTQDAVYCAAMRRFKRMELARDIKKLEVITYVSRENEWDLHKWEPRLSHARFNKTFLSREEVRRVYQRCHSGLALSAEEGAMFACTEYLLCGLPVVTTPNRGGRNRYLRPEYSKTVSPDPKKIQEAVEHFKTNPPSPWEIHRKTTQMMDEDRKAYLKIIQEYGGTATLEKIWGGARGVETHEILSKNLECELGGSR